VFAGKSRIVSCSKPLRRRKGLYLGAGDFSGRRKLFSPEEKVSGRPEKVFVPESRSKPVPGSLFRERGGLFRLFDN
jgi:hypothetical protein